MVIIQTYLVNQVIVISMPGGYFLLLLTSIGRRHGLGGQDEIGILRKVLLQLTQGSILMS